MDNKLSPKTTKPPWRQILAPGLSLNVPDEELAHRLLSHIEHLESENQRLAIKAGEMTAPPPPEETKQVRIFVMPTGPGWAAELTDVANGKIVARIQLDRGIHEEVKEMGEALALARDWEMVT